MVKRIMIDGCSETKDDGDDDDGVVKRGRRLSNLKLKPLETLILSLLV